MNTKTQIQWPVKATHARQLCDGVSVVVERRNFDTLLPNKPFDFGIWRDRRFEIVPKDAPLPVAAPVVLAAPVEVSAPVAPVGFVVRQEGRPVLTWGGRRRFMAEMILDGDKTAREIAAFVIERWPEVPFEKALAQVRGVPQHLKLIGIRATYRKEGGAPVINY